MEDLKKNKLLWILLGVTLLNVGVFALGKLVVDKAAERVIHKLQKDYSPSPYGPGFDPDKVSPEGIKSEKVYFHPGTNDIDSPPFATQEPVKKSNSLVDLASDSIIWRSEWEQDRGFSPLQ